MHEEKQQPEQKFVVKYDVTKAVIAKMDEYKSLTIKGISDKVGFAKVHAARMVAKTARVSIEKQRVEFKRFLAKKGRDVDGRAAELFELIKPIEFHLMEEEDAIKAEKNRIKEEVARKEQERVDGIRARITGMQQNIVSLTGMSSEEIRILLEQFGDATPHENEFQEFVDEAVTVHKDITTTIAKALGLQIQHEIEEEERKAEDARLEKVREQQVAEAMRLKEIEEKQEADAKKERDALKAEGARLAEERRKIQEEKDRLEREEFERKAKEEARIQAEKDAKEKAEREKLEAKERAEREERERVEAEKVEAAEKARQEALKPDTEKFNLWINSHLLNDTEPPVFKDAAICDLANDFESDINTLIDGYIDKAEEL